MSFRTRLEWDGGLDETCAGCGHKHSKHSVVERDAIGTCSQCGCWGFMASEEWHRRNPPDWRARETYEDGIMSGWLKNRLEE